MQHKLTIIYSKWQQEKMGNPCGTRESGDRIRKDRTDVKPKKIIGKDRETCPYRNSTIINGPDSSANARNTYNIQHFYCVFHSGTFCVTTYLPTDREKSRDSGFYAPESLGSYQPTCFSNRSLSFSAAISAFIWGSSPPAAAHSPL